MDVSDDINLQVLHRLSTQFLGGKLPDYVTTDTLEKRASLNTVPASAFGDPGTSAFPCHNRGSTFLSQLFFHGTHANGEPWDGSLPREKVAQRLDEASEFWGIGADVAPLKEAVKAAGAPRELTDDDYALVQAHEGQAVRRFPLINGEAVKMSSANFVQHRVHYPYPWRQATARRLLEKAAEFQVTGSMPEEHIDYLMKAAGFVPSSDHDAAVQLMYRAQVAGNSEARAGLEKLARTVRDGADARDRTELCTLIDTVDRRLKLFNKYAAGLQMPEEVCFQTGIVKAADTDPCISLNTGTVYSLAAIKQAGIDPYAAISTDLAAELAADDHGTLDMEKAAEILPTLPRDQAVILDKAFEANGVARQDAIASLQVKTAALQGNIDATSLDQWYKFAKDRGGRIDESYKIVMHMDHPQRVVPVAVGDSGFLSSQHQV